MYVPKYKIEEADEAIGDRGAIWDKGGRRGQSGAVLTKRNRDQFANLKIASLSNFLFLQGSKIWCCDLMSVTMADSWGGNFTMVDGEDSVSTVDMKQCLKCSQGIQITTTIRPGPALLGCWNLSFPHHWYHLHRHSHHNCQCHYIWVLDSST